MVLLIGYHLQLLLPDTTQMLPALFAEACLFLIRFSPQQTTDQLAFIEPTRA